MRNHTGINRVPVKVGKMTSTATHLPYEYYDGPFCKPEKIKSMKANLGEVLTGDILYSTGYELNMMVNDTCKELCTVKDFSQQTGYELFSRLVGLKYRMTFRMDNMPAVALVEVPLQVFNCPSGTGEGREGTIAFSYGLKKRKKETPLVFLSCHQMTCRHPFLGI